MKTAPTCFDAVTLVITNNAFPDDGVTASKHVGAVFMSILILFF